MKYWQEVAVKIHREAQEALSEMLMNIGSQGIAIDDDLLVEEAMTNSWGDYFPVMNPNDYVTVKAYFFEAKTSKELSVIEQSARELASFGLTVGQVSLDSRLICEEDWANSWKVFYHTEKLGQVVIRPTWEEYTPTTGEIVVALDPGMAFGTGNHDTTAMCILQLQDMDLVDKVIWDIGTGSGILAIIAAKLGSNFVSAVDIDPVAIDVATGNVAGNHVPINVQQGSLQQLKGKSDLIIANIIADVIIDLLADVRNRLNPGGLFLASGIIEHRGDQVKQYAEELGFIMVNERHLGEWVCYCFAREES